MRKMKKDIPVYIFLGFLEAGKTFFIQEAMEGREFNDGKRTLLLLCEEGIEEYEPERCAAPNVFIEPVGSLEELTVEHMAELTEKHRVEQVMVEYNGMWMLNSFYDAMPPEWIIYQVLMVAEAKTFLTFNKNLRSLVFDKLRATEMVVFNRFEHDMDKQEYHKIVRAVNRSADIIYEYSDEEYELDDIIDPLPFDVDAPVIEVKDMDYALWYRDVNEDMKKYIGKTVEIKGRGLTGGGLPKDAFVFGRHVMTCCADDIEFAGLIAKYHDSAGRVEHGGWVKLRAEISVEFHEVYGESGPILNVKELKKAAPPVEEVATF